MPNLFANLVFFIWPLIVMWILRRNTTANAIFIAITCSVLFLPSGFSFDFPLLPPLERDSITALSLIFFLLVSGKKIRAFPPGFPTKILIGYFVTIIISVELNTDPVMIGGRFLQGLTHYDIISSLIRLFLVLVPFFLGRQYLNNLKDNEGIFKILGILGLIYTLPMLIEIRLSPQFHYWVYGYSTGNFFQMMRGDGYRPMVFLGHGLGLAFWFATCIIAILALKKNKVRFTKVSTANVIIYMLVVLLLCKTWSAMLYVGVAMYAISKVQPLKQVKWALLLSTLILLYPLSKATDVFPDREIISTIQQYSLERAESLDFRFVNEDLLLDHALERPYFGWNGWGRNRVYNQYGKDITITDGRWVIEFGVYGAVGFFFYYALYLVTLYYALKNIQYIRDPKEKVYFATLALILAIGLIDSIPNTGMISMHLLLAGALLGQAETLKKQQLLAGNSNAKPLN